MTINALPSGYADFAGLSRLRAAVAADGNTNQDEVAAQFETIFIQQMLKSMRDAVGDGLLASSQSALYQERYDQELSLALARSGGIGIRDLFARSIAPQGAVENMNAPPLGNANTLAMLQPDTMTSRGDMLAGASANMSQRSHRASLEHSKTGLPEVLWTGSAIHGPGLAPAKVSPWTTPSEFVTHVWPHAEAAAHRIGAKPEALVAIAALETGWGKHVPVRTDGTSSNNLFGIKASKGWTAESVTAPTLEFLGGTMVQRNETFRAYDSPADAFQDFATLMQSNKRYAHALERAGDPKVFVTELQKAGYATDPHYAEKLISVLNGGTITQSLSQAEVQDIKGSKKVPIG